MDISKIRITLSGTQIRCSGGFRQHGQSHVHIGRRVGPIALAGKELRNAAAPKIIQIVCIACGLIVLRVVALVPLTGQFVIFIGKGKAGGIKVCL